MLQRVVYIRKKNFWINLYMYVIELLKYTHIQIHRRYKNFFNVIFAIVEFSHRQIAYGLQLQFKIHSCCIFYITHVIFSKMVACIFSDDLMMICELTLMVFYLLDYDYY